jgi:pimeloyl-ACP methyl ester carboxylesterase
VAKAAGSFLALRSRRSASSSGNGEVKKQLEDQQQQQDKEDNDDDGTTSSGSEGLHATLRGMAQQPDLRRDLARLPAPLLLLASSEDRWVLPTHSDATATAMTGWRVINFADV